MLTVIFYVAVVIALFSLVFAMRGKQRLYWIAALATYVFSFLAGFSIGQLTVGLTFVFISLGLGYSFKLIKNSLHVIVFSLAGCIVGVLMVMYIDDYWLFFPFTFLD